LASGYWKSWRAATTVSAQAHFIPLLHGLERKGYLSSTEYRDGKSLRTVYRATPSGKHALQAAKEKVRELFNELIEGR
jgi:DNA-binding PadR family transcriptional regulator